MNVTSSYGIEIRNMNRIFWEKIGIYRKALAFLVDVYGSDRSKIFLRELLKPVSAKKQSRLLAKIPEAGRRTTCTLDTLRKVSDFLAVS